MESRRPQIRRAAVCGAALFALAGCAPQQPYAGLESRAIKALSAKETDGYLSGEGMGFALAAELNGYPGPKHVLEHAETLALSGAQLAETRRLFDEMRAESVALGKALVQKESELDALFAEERIDESSLRAVVGAIAELQGRLRAAHLKHHLKMKTLLSPQQLAKYEGLRGYRGGHNGHH